jgi:hypothetical protein
MRLDSLQGVEGGLRPVARRMGQPTQSGKLYRKVNIEARPNLSYANGQSAPDQAALATIAGAQGATHRARPRSPFCESAGSTIRAVPRREVLACPTN